MKTLNLFLTSACVLLFFTAQAQQNNSPLKKRNSIYDYGTLNHPSTINQKSTQANKYQLNSYLSSYYDNGNWLKLYKEVYTYENDTIQTLEEFYFELEANQWVADESYTYVLHKDGRIDKEYDTDESYIDYIYDTNNNLIANFYIRMNTPPSDYDTLDVFLYSLDSNGNPLLDYHLECDNNLNSCNLSTIDSFAYNSEGVLTARILFSPFGIMEKNEYTYDSNGYRTSSLECHPNSNQWDSIEKRIYYYDSIGNPIEEIKYEYTTEWVPTWKIKYNYNYLYTLSDLIMPVDDADCYWSDNPPVNMIKGYIEYEYIDDQWEIYDTGIYNYSLETVQHAHHATREDIGVYPNPADDFITIETGSVKQGEIYIFDSYGRNVISKPFTNGQQIQLTTLNKGIYFYNIIINGEIHKGTLIKE